MINQDSDASARGALLDIDDAPQCGHAGPHGSACVIRNATHGTHMDADGREWAQPRAPLAAAVTMAAALAVSSPETPAPAAPAAQAAPLGPQVVPYAEGWRAMMARFPSRCGHCSAQILRGDSIGWHAGAREARHDRCVPRAAVAPVAAPVGPAAALAARVSATYAGAMQAMQAAPAPLAAPVAAPAAPAPVAAPDPAGYVTAWPDPAVVLSRLTGQPAAPVAASVMTDAARRNAAAREAAMRGDTSIRDAARVQRRNAPPAPRAAAVAVVETPAQRKAREDAAARTAMLDLD